MDLFLSYSPVLSALIILSAYPESQTGHSETVIMAALSFQDGMNPKSEHQ